ncbi:MAG TPA: CHC2 zinc finger domain-containing protein [Candidatus Kapabacteria bacterium]|nr:CHC2 zinc finger domain-containing protein [Candidatus Kapabacteria bacterium]
MAKQKSPVKGGATNTRTFDDGNQKAIVYAPMRRATNTRTFNGKEYFNEILSRLEKVKPTGYNQYIACCPAHNDKNPSLSVKYDDKNDKVLLHCFAGCSHEEIIGALGLEPPSGYHKNRYTDGYRSANRSTGYHKNKRNDSHQPTDYKNKSSEQKIQLRLITDSKERRFLFENQSKLELREPNQNDLVQVNEKLGRRWRIDTLQALGVRINKDPYAIALWGNEQLDYDYASETCYYVEGRTDLITLYNELNAPVTDESDKSNDEPAECTKYSMVSRYNKSAKITLLKSAKEHIFLLDADDTAENVLSLIDNLKHEHKIKFVHLDGSKDVSDFFYKDGKDILDLQGLITNAKWHEVPFTFWEEVQEGKRTKLEIKLEPLYKFITKNLGYCIMDFDDTNESIVKITGKTVQISTLSKLRKEIGNYLETLGDRVTENFTKSELKERYLRTVNIYIQEAKLQAKARRITFDDFASDGANHAYVYFTNCVVKVTKDGIKPEPYDKLPGLVWEGHKINHNFQLDNDFESFEFYQFLQDLCTNRETDEFYADRFDSLTSAIGYLEHSYNHPSNSFAIIFTDETLEDEPKGRTGKTLLVKQAIGKLRKVTTIDGKSWDNNNRFKFQQVEPDTNIVFLNDISKRFNFEYLFTMIADQTDVERKNENVFSFPLLRRPKIAISTNYPIKGISDSHRARRRDILLCTYYNADYTPEMKFGRRFFDDWNDEEWNKFYNIMIWCLAKYIKNQVVRETPSEVLRKQMFIKETSREFVDWFDEYFDECFGTKDEITVEEMLESYNGFVSNGETDKEAEKKKLSPNEFGKYFKKCIEMNFVNYSKTRKIVDGKKTTVYVRKENGHSRF